MVENSDPEAEGLAKALERAAKLEPLDYYDDSGSDAFNYDRYREDVVRAALKAVGLDGLRKWASNNLDEQDYRAFSAAVAGYERALTEAKPESPKEFVRCPLCHEVERIEDIVGGVCLTCADAIAFSQNARRGAIELPDFSTQISTRSAPPPKGIKREK
jgi:hypothetical protein